MPIFFYTKDTIRGQSAGQKHANCAKGVLSQNPLQAIMKRGDTSSMKIENTTKAVIKIWDEARPERGKVNLLQNISWCETDKTCLFQAKSSLRSALPCFSGKTLSAEPSCKTQHSSLCVAKHNIWLDTMLKHISCRILLETWSKITIILWKRTFLTVNCKRFMFVFVVFNMISTDSEKVSFNCSDKFLEKSGAFFSRANLGEDVIRGEN